MNRDWILQKRETRRTFANATWIPLRANQNDEQEKPNVTQVGYKSEYFGCGSAAFPPKNRQLAEKLNWNELGTHSPRPCSYEDGYYSPIDEYEYNDKEPIGVELVFEHQQPVVGGTKWILNPDLVVALRLIKEGNNWIRPEEDFVVVARETFDEHGNYCLIEIKREFLIDYLAARNLTLRISYYRQRVENVTTLTGTEYDGLQDIQEQRDHGRFELLIRNLEYIYGGNWSMFRYWRTDIDDDEDTPTIVSENNENIAYEESQWRQGSNEGVRVESEYWKNEWIDHKGKSVRVRGDADPTLPQFIVETDGTRMASSELNNEDVGRWLWFRPGIVIELLGHRGFSLKWYTAETGCIQSTSGYNVHFGINTADLVTVYAYDITRLLGWEQHYWAAQNVAPEGKVSSELLEAQIRTKPASTHAVEKLFFISMRQLELKFFKKFGVKLFTHDLDDAQAMQQVTRFLSRDQASLLRLAKEIIRVFSDRIHVRNLRSISTHANKEKLGSNKLLQYLLAKEVGETIAHQVLRSVVGAYDMRVGDAHPTGTGIEDSLILAGIDNTRSYLRQGEQLIRNVGSSIWRIGELLVLHNKNQ